jgi:enamine deaminase RidA (YjgF/YER057c/UK114 family)
MPKLTNAAAHVVAQLEFSDDPDRATEKVIVDFFVARGVEIIDINGAAFVAGQFWSRSRSGQRLITSMHVDLTDLAEQIVTQLQQRKAL